MHRFLAPLAFLALSILAPVAPAARGDAGLAAPVERATALERGLDAIDTARICADLRFIAADELEGRDTPSAGLRIAALFLRARLEALGFRPGAPDGHLWPYVLERRAFDGEASAVVLHAGGEERALAFGDGWSYYSSRSFRDADRRAGIVYCGPASPDDLAAAAVDGRWALVDDSNAHPGRRAERAQAAGAVGVLVLPAERGTWGAARAFNSTIRAAERGSIVYPGDETRIPTVYLTKEGEAALRAMIGPVAVGDLGEVGSEVPIEVAERARLAESEPVEVANVCGFWPGDDPELADEVLIVSAHYDHVGRDGDDIYNGADDNGSGTVGLLAVAEALGAYGPLRRSVMLMWVSGEEKGLLGSRAWSDDPWLPDGARAVADINIDMIGRNAPDSLLITPSPDHEEFDFLTRVAQRLSPEEGFPELGSADDYWSRSDHAMFARLGIPVCFLFSDVHEDYHQPTDTADKVDCDKIRRVSRLVVRMLDALQEDELAAAAN